MLAHSVSQFIIAKRIVRAFECAYIGLCLMKLFNVSSGTVSPPPFPQFRGCFITKASSELWICYVPMISVQSSERCWLLSYLFKVVVAYAFVVVLTLVAISAFRSCSFLCSAIHPTSLLIGCPSSYLQIDKAFVGNSCTSSIETVSDYLKFFIGLLQYLTLFCRHSVLCLSSLYVF
jgi:hypothetical protein